MYLRPYSIAQKFLVLAKQTRINSEGRECIDFKPTDAEILGVITSTPSEFASSTGTKHKATATLIQRSGKGRADIGDMLINGGRKFLVTAVEEAIGGWTIYRLSERFDFAR